MKRISKTKKAKNKSEPLYYRGLPCDSQEEIFFLMWAFELQKAGYIIEIKRGESYLLSEPYSNSYAKQLKTKSKPASETLMQGHSYTPDFEITWSIFGSNKFVWFQSSNTKFDRLLIGKGESLGLFTQDKAITHIEVKPGFDFNNMTRAFKINQKWMWDKNRIFVNLVKPQELFEETFTPTEFLTTPTGKPRKIDWQVKSLNDFINDTSSPLYKRSDNDNS